jgi:hypothetical protein
VTSVLPSSLISRNPLQWVRVFGPGAVIASLTIGVGELVFSSRGGVIFGYAILFPFLMICVLKWTLAYSAARHMVLTGTHPLENWTDLPIGPRGWLTVLFFLLGATFIPVWVSFHSSVLGDLLASLTGTKQYLGGATIHLWGAAVLLGTLVLALSGGYAALEKTQLVIVLAMLAAVVATLFMFGPDWLALMRGIVVPESLNYPDWMATDTRAAVRQIADRPVLVELSLYVGVIGGSSYDYLAYASYLRDKGWGNARTTLAPRGDVASAANVTAVTTPSLEWDDPALRQWLRAPLIDCTLSFVVVLLFSAVFVAAGKLVLGPEHQLPGDGAFLEHQAQFVTRIDPALYPLYVVAVSLALLGTLYGTLEVAPTVLRETTQALRWPRPIAALESRQARTLAISWCAGVALLVLAVSFAYQWRAGHDRPPGLTAVLAPVNLFTGVFGCGLICLLNPWIDRRLPVQHRLPLALIALNVIGGAVFLLVGLRGYWEYAGWWAIGVLLGTFVLGFAIAWLSNRNEQP